MKKYFLMALAATSLIATDYTDAATQHLSRMVTSNGVKFDSPKVLASASFADDWSGYFISFKISKGDKEMNIAQPIFTNGEYFSGEVFDKQGNKLNPKVPSTAYKTYRLVAGNPEAKNKILIISDPLCGHCKQRVPAMIGIAEKNKDVAVYVVHKQLFPESETVIKTLLAAELAGHKDVVKNYYIFGNKTYEGLNLDSKEVLERFSMDGDLANNLFVSGTPTIFVNDYLDQNGRLISLLIQ